MVSRHPDQRTGPYVDLKGGRDFGERDFGLRTYDAGGNPVIPVVAGAEGHLDRGAPREMDRITREFAVNAERIGRYLGDLASDLAGNGRTRPASRGERRSQSTQDPVMAMLAGASLEPWAAWSQAGMTGTGATLPPASAPWAPPGPSSVVPVRQPAQARQDPMLNAMNPGTETSGEMLRRSGADVPNSPAPDGRDPFTRDFNGGGYDVRTLKQDVARSIGSKISGWQPGPDLAADASGVMRHVVGGEAVGPAASSTEIASAGRWGKVSGMTKNFVGALGEGKAPMAALQGALPANAAKALGVAGAAVALTNEGLNYAASQRDVNRGWQQVLGGSNAEGFGERAQSQMFEWGMKGTMGSGAASQLYKGAAEIYGTDRGARNAAVGFGVDMYRKVGMDIADSLALVETAARQGNEGLGGLREAIKGVSETARQAGGNVQSAQKLFASNLEGLTPVAGGSVATSLAGVLTEAQVGLGHQFKGVDFSGLTSTNNMYRMSSRAHQKDPTMTTADFQAKFATDDKFAADAITGGLREASLGILQTYGGDGAVEMVRSKIAAIQKSGREPTDDDWMDIGADLQTEYDITPQMVQQVMKEFGVDNLTSRNAVAFLAHTTDEEQFDFGKKVDERKSKMGTRKKLNIGKDDKAEMQGNNSDIARLREKLGGDKVSGKGGTGIATDKKDRARNLYINQLIDGKKTNPVLEALIDDFQGDRRFKVKTKGGKEKIVTTDDLIRDFGDQAFQGDVELVKGNIGDSGPGTTIGEALGLDNRKSPTPSAGKSSGKGKGMDDDWSGKKDYKNGTTGRVEIVLKGKAAQYLDASTSGSAYTDESRYNGVPPSSSRPSSEAPDGGG